ncbi:Uncharacterised protein [Listeria grayi]|uniref:Uncharacterized protein n=1 Tax=Listeria grayi TaxID=1641 RepID=A0A378MFX7_LISGR|nr:hypothetical protein [Listeria grayi]STY45270.1 Uncharacterised protein [Listeria grayi]
MLKKGFSIILASFLLFGINAVPADAATHYKLTASVSNKKPKQYSTIILYTKGLPKKQVIKQPSTIKPKILFIKAKSVLLKKSASAVRLKDSKSKSMSFLNIKARNIMLKQVSLHDEEKKAPTRS